MACKNGTFVHNGVSGGEEELGASGVVLVCHFATKPRLFLSPLLRGRHHVAHLQTRGGLISVALSFPSLPHHPNNHRGHKRRFSRHEISC